MELMITKHTQEALFTMKMQMKRI